MSKKDNWIQTFTGKKFYPFAPIVDDICIEDIAHSLSLICRFNGHCRCFYSVAQHSSYVSVLAGNYQEKNIKGFRDAAMIGLLHDAAEAYLGDIPSPIKSRLDEKHEEIILKAIRSAFGLNISTPEIDSLVNRIDLEMLTTEKLNLMTDNLEWPGIKSMATKEFPICPQDPEKAEKAFLSRFHWLKDLRY